MSCKICMVERKEILHCLRKEKHKVINCNNERFGSCSCRTRFHKFSQGILLNKTLKTCLAQKKVPTILHTKTKRPKNKAIIEEKPFSLTILSPSSVSSELVTPEKLALSFDDAGFFTNLYSAIKTITGKSPTRDFSDPPTNLEIAQIEEFRRINCNLELCRFSAVTEC